MQSSDNLNYDMKKYILIKKWVPIYPLEEVLQYSSVGFPGMQPPRLYKYCVLVKDSTSESYYPEGAYRDYIGCPEDLNNYKVIEVPGVFPSSEFEGFMKQLEELSL